MKYYLDTNIIISFIKDALPSVYKHFLSTPSQSITVPSIVIGEIEYGAKKSQNYTKTISLYSKFLKTFDIADFDEESAKIYGIIRSNLEKRGTVIGNNDMLIASIVMANDGVLITHNTKEFSRIEGLKIEDWVE